MDEILNLSATEQAQRLERGELSSLELTNLYLDRIQALNEQLHAFTYVADKRARWAAKQWDAKKRKGKAPRSPLSGVPTGIKDLALVRGMPARFGTRALPPVSPLRDGLITRRVRSAGMIITGKLSTSELGAMPVTEPDTHAATRNPFNLDHTAGGSSGGSGAAVAAALLPIAQGSDGAGSIRIPSSVGHLVGLKATRGLISHVTPVDKELRLANVGPLARTVQDLAAFFDCISDWPQDFVTGLEQDLPKGLRVALSTETQIAATAPAYQEAARKVATILEEQGSVVEERPWLDVSVDDFLVLWKRLIANAPFLMEKRLQPITAWLRSEGKKISKADATATRIRLERVVLDWFGDHDLWISPTIAIKPPRIGAWRDPDAESSFRNILGMGAYTAGFNVSGQPAISVPMGFCDEGLPIGVQIVGRVGQDALVMRAAKAVEEAVGGFRVPSPL